MNKIKSAHIMKHNKDVFAIICGKEYQHYIKFDTVLEATTFFDEILNYNDWTYADYTKQKESVNT